MTKPVVKFRVACGSKMIEDMLNPKPEEIDLKGIEKNLKAMKRYASNPDALTVHQHRLLVYKLAVADTTGYISERIRPNVLEWCLHHDDHEGIIGDIISPVEVLIRSQGNILDRVKAELDIAICIANGVGYPTYEVRNVTHHYDKMAGTLEWIHCLKRPPTKWNYKVPEYMEDVGYKLTLWAQTQ